MTRKPVLLGFLLVSGTLATLYAARPEGLSQQPLAKVDVKKVQRFCDVGFRITASGIQFDIEKLFGLGLKIDPKVLQVLDSQATVQVTALTLNCRMLAAGMISPERFLEAVKDILQYAADLQAARERAEKESGTSVSPKPAGGFDPKTAASELDFKIETSIQTSSGELNLVLRTLAARYLCQCRPERTAASLRPAAWQGSQRALFRKVP